MASIQYTPDPGFVGVDQFRYSVTNPDGSSSEGTVTVTIGSPGALPTVTYTPDPGFTGVDQFEYQFTNPDGTPSTTGTVVVTILDGSDPNNPTYIFTIQPDVIIRPPDPGELIDPGYRFLVSDLATGRVTGELPATASSWVEELNGPGGVTMTAPLLEVSRSDVSEWRSALWIERYGKLIAGGIVTLPVPDLDRETVTFIAPGFRHYLDFRRFDGDYTSTDQIQIASELAAKALDIPNVRVPAQIMSGVLRDRTWPTYEPRYAGELLGNLEQVIDGFDSWFVPQWENGTPTVVFDTSYPATGRSTRFVFEQDTNCDVIPTYDGTDTVNDIAGYGAGEGRATLQVSATADRDGMPPLEGDVTLTDISRTETLQGHVDRELLRRRQPIDRIELRIFPGSRPTLGAYRTGDRVRVKADVGYINVDETCRLTRIAGHVTEGDEQVTAIATPLEVFQ